YLQTIRRLSGPGQHGIISQRKVATPMGAGSRTVGRVMSRTVIWLVVGGAIVIAAGLGVAWQVRMNEQAALDRATKPTAAVPQATPPAASRATTAGAAPPA